jgi:HSP20 family protein
MSFGTFERSFKLPISVDPDGVEAAYADGILEVRLPRKAPRSRHIPVIFSPAKE